MLLLPLIHNHKKFISSDEQTSSKILLNSQNEGNTWNNLFTFQQTNSEFNFNYTNGVLRVSDGNFRNGNLNKMFYYQKGISQSGLDNSGWKTKNNFLLNSPSISFKSHVPEDDAAGLNPESQELGTFDAIPYCNKLYKNITYTTPGIFLADGTSRLPAIPTDWKFNNFGRNNSTGIVTRYFWSADPTEQHNFSILKINTGTEGDAYIKAEEPSSSYEAFQKHIVAAGFSTMTQAYWTVSDNGYTNDNVQDLYTQGLWPFKILIKSNTLGKHHDWQNVWFWQCQGKTKWIIKEKEEYILSPGDLIYVPKNWTHEVIALSHRVGISMSDT